MDVLSDPTTGEIHLCMMFYRYMNKRRKNVTHFKDAITYLEAATDIHPVYDSIVAARMLSTAKRIAYGHEENPYKDYYEEHPLQ